MAKQAILREKKLLQHVEPDILLLSMTVYPTRKSPPLILIGMGSLLVFLPFGIGILTGSDPEAIGELLLVGLITIPPGLLFCSMGAALLRLRLKIDTEAGMLRARLPRSSWIVFPWQVKSFSMPFASVDQVDAKWRKNPYMEGGIEGLYFIRTIDGDFYFNSKWFPDHEEIATRLTELAGVESTSENLDLPPVVVPGQPPPKLAAAEIAMRGCGYAVLVASVVLVLLTLFLFFFGEPGKRGGTIKALLILSIGIPASLMLISYRKAR